MAQKRERKQQLDLDLLTRAEVAQHLILIDDLERQIKRPHITDARKQELRKQIRNLRAELWVNKQTKQPTIKTQNTYKGAEF